MRTRTWYSGVVLALAAIACSLAASADARSVAGAPPEATITGVSPTQAVVGQRITISGNDLSGTAAVTFGTIPSKSVVVDPGGTWVRAVVPAGVPIGSVPVTLDVQGTPYSTSVQIVAGSVPAAANPQPKVSSGGGVQPPLKVAPRISIFSPRSGHAGMKVRITGANLNGASWVKFGFVQAQIKSNTDKAIIAIVPRSAHSGKIRVHTSGGTGVSTGMFKIVGSAGV